MSRWLLILLALLLPLQFAWSSASAYCGHESERVSMQVDRSESERSSEQAAAEPQQSQHFGHHFHAHHGELKQSAGGQPMADADCASCHASGSAAIPTQLGRIEFAAASAAATAVPSPAFTSALVRAPDRPQWPRLVV